MQKPTIPARAPTLFGAALLLIAGCGHGRPATLSGADTVHVSPPTGERQTDRASILAALARARPGSTIQFAAGEYLAGGEIIRLTTPRIALQGHPDGTTLRGCHPGEFPADDPDEIGDRCNLLELAGAGQAVRDLTLDHAFWALHIGCCWDGFRFRPGEGGHLVEGNTFRRSWNAVRVHGYWSEPSVIRNNRFRDNWHTVAIYGNTAHLLDNDIAAPEPDEVPGAGFPAEGVHIAWPLPLEDGGAGAARTCDHNVVAGNRIRGVTEGIMVTGDTAGIGCRDNVIRGNTIAIRRARPPALPGFIPPGDPGDPTVVGVPLALRGAAVANLVEGNVIEGAEGLGIEVRHGSRNRIVGNVVKRVIAREPFPGNAIVALPVLGGAPEAWRDANGSAIWVSPGSVGNEIVDNTFEDVAGAAVWVEGDSNRVELRSVADSVRDRGRGNRVAHRPEG